MCFPIRKDAAVIEITMMVMHLSTSMGFYWQNRISFSSKMLNAFMLMWIYNS